MSGGSRKFNTFDCLWQNNNCNDDNITCFITKEREERTFYRYMSRIYEQDKAYFEKQDNESIATEIRLAKERILKSLRRFDAMAADESLSAAERMEAERCRGDIVIALVKIEIEGPRIVHDTLRRLLSNENK
jgi:glutamyl/glutaminyl-tRNA synthetase